MNDKVKKIVATFRKRGKKVSETTTIETLPLNVLDCHDIIRELSKDDLENTTKTDAMAVGLSNNHNPIAVVSDTPLADRATLLQEIKANRDTLTFGDLQGGDEVVRAKLALERAKADYSVSQTKAKKAQSIAMIEKVIAENTKRVSTAEVYYMPRQGYYVCYDNGVYIKTDTATPDAMFRKLVHRRGNEKGNSQVVIQASITPLTDLTRGEFDAIFKGKPALEDLLKVYRLFDNRNLTINIDKVSPIY